MEKIPFKVSARTAKLIGQENFSNPEGAAIELVKNCYDADAKNCLVIFDIKYEEVPDHLSNITYKQYSSESKLVQTSYTLRNKQHTLLANLDEKKRSDLQEFFFSKNSIYIIDNGEGMNSDVIRNQWMEIGTGNKEIKFTSDDGRIKTGAKGIGRFALDRLGHLSEMWTVPKEGKGKDGFYWRMDWKQFENAHQPISDIKAELEEQNFDIKKTLQSLFADNDRVLEFIKKKSFRNGTIIKVSCVKDNWFESSILSVFKSLEALIPPKELAIPFGVNFYHLQNRKLFGEVETAYFNDFDYKVSSTYDASKREIKLLITRNELDLKKVKATFSHLFKGTKPPYNLQTLQKKSFTISKSAYELLKWEDNASNRSVLKNLGSFSFSFYFLKNVSSQKEGYPYKDFNPKERTEILDKFGGVKIYRDSFRVRPYGDSGNDWLKLGQRASKSPAGAGQRIGDWRVGPNQIAGLINISRIENSDLVDKSDRGALVENESFRTLQKLVIAVVNQFELDRSTILNQFYIENQLKKDEERKKEIRIEAEKLADKIVEERQKVEEKLYGKRRDLFHEKKQKEEKESYKKIIEEGFEKINKVDNDNAEIAQVRTLASLGLIVSSFAHELKTVKNNLDEIKKLEQIYNHLFAEDRKKSVEFKDGIDIIELLKEDNLKIAHWVDYALTAIKKDKRKRTSLKFDKYFPSFEKSWKRVFVNSNINFEFANKITRPYTFSAFEMDMNTIFNNLVINSIDAFHNLKVIKDREISIIANLIKSKIIIVYSDNGTGLAKMFQKNRDEIFLPFVTSKKDKDNNDIGTGLGMYLVKNVVADNNGTIEIVDSNVGFKVKIEFPVKSKKV